MLCVVFFIIFSSHNQAEDVRNYWRKKKKSGKIKIKSEMWFILLILECKWTCFFFVWDEQHFRFSINLFTLFCDVITVRTVSHPVRKETGQKKETSFKSQFCRLKKKLKLYKSHHNSSPWIYSVRGKRIQNNRRILSEDVIFTGNNYALNDFYDRPRFNSIDLNTEIRKSNELIEDVEVNR